MQNIRDVMLLKNKELNLKLLIVMKLKYNDVYKMLVLKIFFYDVKSALCLIFIKEMSSCKAVDWLFPMLDSLPSTVHQKYGWSIFLP